MRTKLILPAVCLVLAVGCKNQTSPGSHEISQRRFLRKETVHDFDILADTSLERTWTKTLLNQTRADERYIAKAMEPRRREDDFYYYASVGEDPRRVFTVRTEHDQESSIFLIAMTDESSCDAALLSGWSETNDEFDKVTSRTADGKQYIRERLRGAHRTGSVVYWEHSFTRVAYPKQARLPKRNCVIWQKIRWWLRSRNHPFFVTSHHD